ncbi:MAG TPA: DcrB-related protein [Byssovorax sp.]
MAVHGAYRMNEAAFELPARATDRTTHRLRVEGSSVRLSFSRTPLDGDTLDARVAENQRSAAIHLTAHRVIASRRLEIAGLAGHDVAATWRGEAGVVYTRQAHLAAAGAWLTLAASAAEAERAACDAAFERALASLTLREA